jgi:hypothetical protein
MVRDRFDGESELPLLEKALPATTHYAKPVWIIFTTLQTILLLVLVYQCSHPNNAKTSHRDAIERYFSLSREHMTLAASSDHLWRENDTSGVVNISDTMGTRIGSVTMSERPRTAKAIS